VEEYIEFSQPCNSKPDSVLISVVIVAYKTKLDLITCLVSLKSQSFSDFEIIVVDNGGNESIVEEIINKSNIYIRTKNNLKPSLARNIGTVFSSGSIVCFIDDDAIAHRDCIAYHYQAHQEDDLLGVRGRILPKTNSLYNYLITHSYDLGTNKLITYIDMEGNSSFERTALIEIGGFNSQVFSGEGIELTYRLATHFQDHKKFKYIPQAIVYHDYSQSLSKMLRKVIRNAKMDLILRQTYPQLDDFIQLFPPRSYSYTKPKLNFFRRVQLAMIRRMSRYSYNLALKIWKARG
jgi:glycosyltransferase involved in cell wall biosynthesis